MDDQRFLDLLKALVSDRLGCEFCRDGHLIDDWIAVKWGLKRLYLCELTDDERNADYFCADFKEV